MALKVFLSIFVVTLLSIRAYLPIYLEDYVNDVLNNIGDYKGQVEDIDVSLLRGAYQIEGLRLYEKGDKNNPFFIDCRFMDLSIQWASLVLSGKIVSDIDVEGLTIDFTPTGSNKKKNPKTSTDWTVPIRELMPININEVILKDSRVIVLDKTKESPTKLSIDHIQGSIKNLRNTFDKGGTLPSSIQVQAKIKKKGQSKLDGKLNILKPVPSFDVDAQVEDIELKSLNTYFQELAYVDFSQGTLNVYAELASNDQEFKGYIKPILLNTKLFDLKADKNFLNSIWQAVSGILLEVLENQSKEQFAMVIPLEGRVDDIQSGGLSTALSILQNAFINALSQKVDKSLNIGQLEIKKASSE